MPDVYVDRGLEIAESECSVNGLRLSFERRFYTEKGEEVVNALQGVTQIAYIEHFGSNLFFLLDEILKDNGFMCGRDGIKTKHSQRGTTTAMVSHSALCVWSIRKSHFYASRFRVRRRLNDV